MMIHISEHFDRPIFDKLNQLWEITGISNPQRGDTYEAIEKTLQHEGKLITIWHCEILIGSCWLTSDSRRLYLHHMAVLPGYQNQGIGHQLMAESIRYSTEKQLQLKLEVNESNQSAIHLYQKFGFAFIDHYQTMIRRKIGD